MKRGKYIRTKEIRERTAETLRGRKFSEEHRRNIGESSKGRKHTKETKKKISKTLSGEKSPMYGKHHSQETREKMSEVNKGEKHYNYGKHHSEETKRKISETLKGRSPSEETKKKLSEVGKGKIGYWKGKKLSEEHKRKIGEVQKGEKSGRWKGGRKAMYERQKNNLKYQLSGRMKAGINDCLKRGIKNGRTWQSLVNYSTNQLKERLQSTMPEGYTWDDYLSGDLHIDHIVPVKEFKFEKPEDLQFQQCWALSNLRLLPKIENLKKGAKLIKSFQTSLEV